MSNEVLAGLAAAFVATLGSVTLALLKVTLWVVILVGVVLFGVLFVVGAFIAGRWALQRMTGKTDDLVAGNPDDGPDQ